MTERKPKPACIIKGEPWWNYLYSYRFEEAEYSFSIAARSEVEAHERLKKIALARYEGQQDGKPIPLYMGGFLAPLIVWWRNLNAVR